MPHAVEIVCVALLKLTLVAGLSCKDMYGREVDSWTGYKMPQSADSLKNPGYTMAYWDNNSVGTENWHWQDLVNKSETDTALYQTTTQLPYMNDYALGEVGYIAYNDQVCVGDPHEQDKCNVTPNEPGTDPSKLPGCKYGNCDKHGKKYAHAKGFLVFDSKGGFWMIHSVPGFPLNQELFERYGWSWYKTMWGQHFHCLSLAPDAIEQVATTLKYSYVQPIDGAYFVPPSLQAAFPNTYAIVSPENKHHYHTGTHYANIATRGGDVVLAFGKEGDADHKIDLWEGLVAPTLGTSLKVETWCSCGFGPDAYKTCTQYDSRKCPGGCICKAPNQPIDPAYCCQKSVCNSGKERVQQIELMNWSGRVVQKRTVASIQTHAKWGLSQDASKPWVCWGDINRQYTQRARGGGGACMSSYHTWKLLNHKVAQWDSCE